MIKDMWKGIILLITGLIAAVLIYPFIHELGHILLAWIVGAEVKKVSLFPTPNVLCNIRGVSNISKVIIGFGGMVSPLLISITFPRKPFYVWYNKLILQSICLFSFVISFVSIIANINVQDDMVRILCFWNYGKVLLLVILGLLSFITIMIIKKDKPIERICKYFQIEKGRQ